MKSIPLYLVILISLAACRVQPPQAQKPVAPVNKFSDATLRAIHTLKDERNTPTLLQYLHHSKAAYRTEAALAFASVQDTLALPQLLTMLTDTTTAVREAAAFAIGQTGHRKAETGLIQHLKQEKRPVVQAALLEALGKIATPAGVEVLATYTATNDHALAGQAWGLFRAGMRQHSSIKAIDKAVKILAAPSSPLDARLAAAHFLARTPRIDLTSSRQPIITAATSDPSAEIRMALAQAIAKIRTSDKAAILAGIAQNDSDYRVRINAIRAMAGLEDNKQAEQAILAGLTDSNLSVAVATAEFIQASTRKIDTGKLEQALRQVQDERVRSGIMWILLRNSTNQAALSNQYKQRYHNTHNPYHKGYLLKALAADFDNYRFIEQEIFSAKQPIVATYGIEALAAMRLQPGFPKTLEQEFARIFKKAIGSGDVALVGVAAGVMRAPDLNFRDAYTNLGFLKEAQQQLELPRDTETFMELQKTINYLNGRPEAVQPRPPYTHPIDWTLVQKIPANQRVLLKTDKGDIELQLFVEDAPATVANFVALAQQHFYDGLYFHRVVPNFVVQGGDKRGDGWGSSPYAIRSEFAPLYFRTGYIGMASAGKDTESNQWFITHSPTPHLDGRYSVFGLVVNGMEVVHQLQVGDKILSIELK
ncbi:peptidylprolyl isomerase [Botryobacter ruber]|uniref:peptidylprolyl isomerase n=1 Tax=Botryobacter ruber TaxID=2171629 RepID=UPI000E0B38CB|nr:peptidylprolyl isomerase [Botryobacter ruber]